MPDPTPVVVCLRWCAEETLPNGKPLTLISHDWRGWVIEQPADWAPLISRLNALEWSLGFELQEPGIGQEQHWVRNQPALAGLNPPMLWFEDDHGIGALAINLVLRRDIPREWSDDWHERAWRDLEAQLPAFESALASLSPLPLGRLRAEGRTHWANRAPSDAAAWSAQRERAILRSEIPKGGACGPKPRPGL